MINFVELPIERTWQYALDCVREFDRLNLLLQGAAPKSAVCFSREEISEEGLNFDAGGRASQREADIETEKYLNSLRSIEPIFYIIVNSLSSREDMSFLRPASPHGESELGIIHWSTSGQFDAIEARSVSVTYNAIVLGYNIRSILSGINAPDKIIVSIFDAESWAIIDLSCR